MSPPCALTSHTRRSVSFVKCFSFPTSSSAVMLPLLAPVAQGAGQGKISLASLGGDDKGGFGHTWNKLNPLRPAPEQHKIELVCHMFCCIVL